MNQMENLKINSNNEIQRLKSQISELEKITEKAHRAQSLEIANKELDNELKTLKSCINKLFRNIQGKVGDSKNLNFDENQVRI
jgi:predicted RNase H-like nuclease (RuvC/YqgF family)